MLSSLEILCNEKSILELKEFRKQYFWDNNFFIKREKLEYDFKVKMSVFAHYASWFIIVLVCISIITTPFFPQTIFNEEWSYLTQLFVKASAYLFVLFGYYIVATYEGFYAYTILHAYFQMNILTVYLRHEFRHYENMDLSDKIYSYRYQTLIQSALLRCIKQHKRVVT